MTVTKSYAIDLSDIKTVNLVCHVCATSLKLPPDNIQRHTASDRCPNCGTPWFADATPEREALSQFLAILKELRKRSDKQVCQIRIEIDKPE